MLQVGVTLIDGLVSLLSLFMNNKNKEKPKKITTEPRDNLVALIESLAKMDKSPNLNRPKSKNLVVLNKNGDWVTL